MPRTIASLKEVEIILNEKFNFIVARVDDHTGSKLVMRANQGLPRHRDIVENLRKETELFVYCVGGGSMCISKVTKLLIIFGESEQYGREPNREETVKMLERRYPGFEVTAIP